MMSYGTSRSFSYPALNARAFLAKSRPSPPSRRSSSIQGWRSAYRRTIWSVPSVDPSLTMIHRIGAVVCLTTDCERPLDELRLVASRRHQSVAEVAAPSAQPSCARSRCQPSPSCRSAHASRVTVSATNRIQKNQWIRSRCDSAKPMTVMPIRNSEREEGECGRRALEQPRCIGERAEQIDAGDDGRRNAELGGHVHDAVVRAARRRCAVIATCGSNVAFDRPQTTAYPYPVSGRSRTIVRAPAQMRVRPFNGSSLPSSGASGAIRNGDDGHAPVAGRATTDASRSSGPSRRPHAIARPPHAARQTTSATKGVRERACATASRLRAQSVAPHSGWTCRLRVTIRKKIVARAAAAPRLFLCAMMPRHPDRRRFQRRVRGTARETAMLDRINTANVQCSTRMAAGVDRCTR